MSLPGDTGRSHPASGPGPAPQPAAPTSRHPKPSPDRAGVAASTHRHSYSLQMWREQILTWSSGARLYEPANLAEVHAAEAALGQEFPSDLVDLLVQTDGLADQDDEASGPGAIVWP